MGWNRSGSCIMCCRSFPNETGEGIAPSFQHPLRIGAARFHRQAASGYAPAPVLRTKPCASLPHRGRCEVPAPTRDSDLRASWPSWVGWPSVQREERRMNLRVVCQFCTWHEIARWRPQFRARHGSAVPPLTRTRPHIAYYRPTRA